jgi:hypothetical protein
VPPARLESRNLLTLQGDVSLCYGFGMSKNSLPTALPGGYLLPHMSARRRNEIVDVVFEQIGGPERMVAWAERPENYGDFITKVWAKGLPRAVSNEHTVGGGVEDLLDQLDRADKAKVINGELVDDD